MRPLGFGSCIDDTFKPIAIIECAFANSYHTIGNRDTRQVIATRECIIADALDTVGNCDTRQIIAPRERTTNDANCVISKNDRVNTFITINYPFAKIINTILFLKN